MNAIKKSKSINGTSQQFLSKLMEENQSYLPKGIGKGNIRISRTPGKDMVDVVSRLIMHFEKES